MLNPFYVPCSLEKKHRFKYKALMLPSIFSVSTLVDVFLNYHFFCTPGESHAEELQTSLTCFSFYQLYIISSIACVISTTHNIWGCKDSNKNTNKVSSWGKIKIPLWLIAIGAVKNSRNKMCHHKITTWRSLEFNLLAQTHH